MVENKVNPKQINSLALAYMGDAVIELFVRQYLIEKGSVNPNRLHHQAVGYVSAKAQAAYLRFLTDGKLLSDEELSVVRRGRNAKSGTTPKNTDVLTYRHGTAFEALIGHLYFINADERITELMDKMFQFQAKEKR